MLGMRGDQNPSQTSERPGIFDEEYRKAIRRIESFPQNQSGQDKSWVWEALRQSEEHFAKARRTC